MGSFPFWQIIEPAVSWECPAHTAGVLSSCLVDPIAIRETVFQTQGECHTATRPLLPRSEVNSVPDNSGGMSHLHSTTLSQLYATVSVFDSRALPVVDSKLSFLADVQAVAYEEPKHWCSIVYYELNNPRGQKRSMPPPRACWWMVSPDAQQQEPLLPRAALQR